MYFALGCIFDILKNYILNVDKVLRAGLYIHGYYRKRSTSRTIVFGLKQNGRKASRTQSTTLKGAVSRGFCSFRSILC